MLTNDLDRLTKLYTTTGFIAKIDMEELPEDEQTRLHMMYKNIPPIMCRCTNTNGLVEYLEPKQFKKQPKRKYTLVINVRTK